MYASKVGISDEIFIRLYNLFIGSSGYRLRQLATSLLFYPNHLNYEDIKNIGH